MNQVAPSSCVFNSARSAAINSGLKVVSNHAFPDRRIKAPRSPARVAPSMSHGCAAISIISPGAASVLIQRRHRFPEQA